jgi:S-methylmethionine-dependent homocysteine/selenocysteine methylase
MAHALDEAKGWVTDGGLETDLLFRRGIDLPEFAAFPLVEDADGVAVLTRYYRDYATIAGRAGAGLVLETPTWRANPDWAARLGYDAEALDRANRAAVALVRACARDSGLDRVLVSGVVGPRGDGYVAAGGTADAAADYHAQQVAVLAAEGVDYVHAMTINEPSEALGVVRAARAADIAVAVSFTVETDGTLPDGTPLASAVEQVDAEGGPDWYGINCAHPTHVLPAMDGGEWQQRLRIFRPNASILTHAELDLMEELDTGDRPLLAASAAELRERVPSLSVIGGCCGTDASHVAMLWGLGPEATGTLPS